MSHPIRVGFDLDGVILYNPARIARIFVKNFKHQFLPKRENTFYIPKSSLAKLLWRMFHWSSLFIAPGYEDIKKLSKKGKIEAYIITARFDFLEKDFNHWLDKMHINHTFKGTFLNKKNEQPHIFKEKMVKKLKLDYFVEDNWDIVNHLDKHSKTKVFWIYNIFDRKIKYHSKFPSLEKAVKMLTK